jgi:hypothetical protein
MKEVRRRVGVSLGCNFLMQGGALLNSPSNKELKAVEPLVSSESIGLGLMPAPLPPALPKRYSWAPYIYSCGLDDTTDHRIVDMPLTLVVWEMEDCTLLIIHLINGDPVPLTVHSAPVGAL